MPVAMRTSSRLRPLPPIDPDRSVTVRRSSAASWPGVLSAHPGAFDFLVDPDSYLDWGRLDLGGIPGGTPGRPRTIRRHAPGDNRHPVDLAGTDAEVRVSGLFVDHVAGPVSDWMVDGMTTRGGTSWTVSKLNQRITFSRCLIEGFAGTHGVRFRGSKQSGLQQSVVRNAVDPLNTVGVYVGGLDVACEGAYVLDSEIFGVGDCILQDQGPPDNLMLGAWGIYDGNDLWSDGRNENGIDIKGGSDDDDTLIQGNRIWGVRHSASAAGDAIVVHRYGRRVVIGGRGVGNGNILADCASGIREEIWPAAPVRRTRSLSILGNHFIEIRVFPSGGTGACVAFGNDGAVEDNIASGCGGFIGRSPGYLGAGPTYRRNALRATPVFAADFDPRLVAAWRDADNSRQDRPEIDVYERRRWTGPRLGDGTAPSEERTFRGLIPRGAARFSARSFMRGRGRR